jgi:phosphatidylethanolamine-binding protein (PEBP) family uncharacterized protein
MKSYKRPLALALAFALGAAGIACSESSDGGGTGGSGSGGTGGSTGGRGGSGGSSTGGTGGSSTGGTGGSSTGGTGGSTGGTGGSTGGTGGSTGGTGGSTGGTGGTGGSTGGTGGSTGGTGGSSADGGKMDTMGDGSGGMEAGTGAFTITGDFSMMGANKCFKSGNTRTTGNPANQSPAIMWSNPPASTMSFAVSLRDLQGGIHWVMWNIPPTATGLAAALPSGAMPGAPAPMGSSQFSGMGGQVWYGPGANDVHRYEYQVWALKVASLPAGSNKNTLYNTLLPAERIGSAKIHACGNAGASCSGCPAGPNP